MSAKLQPRHDGKFDSTLTDLERYDVIAAVALHGRPDNPEKITMRGWDDARAGAGFPDAPTARAMTMYFVGRGWAQILSDALSNHRNLTQVEAKRTASEERSDLDFRHVRFAIRSAALARSQETISETEYAETRDKMIAADKRRPTGGLMERLMPTVGQIRFLLGNGPNAWVKAVEDVAGLRPPVQKTQPKGMSLVDAYVLYVEVASARCGRHELIRFARDSGFKLSSKLKGAKWSSIERQVAERLAADGLQMPAKNIGRGAKPIADLALVPVEYHQVEETIEITRDVCIAALRHFHGLLPKRAKRTRAAYIREVPNHPEWPWPNHFDKWGGFAALRDEAVELGPLPSPEPVRDDANAA
jgi:hypothetical protein